MKFTCMVDIAMDRDQVVALWRDPMNLIDWQDGFKSISPLSGVPGELGATSRISYVIGKTNKEMELIETITLNSPPDQFHASYVQKHMDDTMHNYYTMHNYFTILNNGHTRWESEIHYTEIKSLPFKVMAKLFPSIFRQQVQKWMDQFKGFVER